MRLGRRQAWLDACTSAPFIAIEIAGTLIAIWACWFVTTISTGETVSFNATMCVCILAMTLLFQHLHGLYPACGVLYSSEFSRLLRTCVMVIVALAVGILSFGVMTDASGVHRIPNSLGLAAFGATLTFIFCSYRPIARRILGRYDWWAQPVLIAGCPDEAIKLHDRLNGHRTEGLRSVGVIYDPSDQWGSHGTGNLIDPRVDTFVGPSSDLESIMLDSGCCRLAVVGTSVGEGNDFHIYHGIPHVMQSINLGHSPTELSRLSEREGIAELSTQSSLTCPFSIATKRMMDLTLIAATAPAWLLIMVTVAICIKLFDPGPLFYRQTRVGKFRRSFNAIKFRTMVTNADQKLQQYLTEHPELALEWQESHKLRNDPRITTIGRFLRQTSLDELPQFFNILRGEMSLVGPRPIVDCHEYDREYIDDHPEVFQLYQMAPPGITGLWQISGRNSLPYKERIALDRFYLFNWSVSLDIFILWRTLKTAVMREGAY